MSNIPTENREIYMNRVFDLALKGIGCVTPNPMVGCVIVKDGKVLGEGWHMQYGQPHAEINAINSVKDKADLQGADLYVNLEPCSHAGKTPPCAPVVADIGFKNVIISNVDPNPLVNGTGIEIIENAGTRVEIGVLSEKGKYINRRFFTYHQKKRPYIILKWAETSDGFIARENYDSKWISNPLSRKLVHKWRSEEQAIMVGHNTVKHDNPSLTVRDWSGKNPLRMVLGNNVQINSELHIFDGTTPTVVYDTEGRIQSLNKNIEVVHLDNEQLLDGLMLDMYNRKILSLIVEGGAQLLNTFIEPGLWDEARVFSSQEKFGSGIKAPVINKSPSEFESIAGDELKIYYNYG